MTGGWNEFRCMLCGHYMVGTRDHVDAEVMRHGEGVCIAASGFIDGGGI